MRRDETAAISAVGEKLVAAVQEVRDRLPEPLERLEPMRVPGRQYDALGRQQPRQIPSSVVAQAIPGLAGQFGKVVPEAHLEDDVVVCRCEARTQVGGGITKCVGDCSRFFWRFAGAVRVAGPYEDDTPAAA